MVTKTDTESEKRVAEFVKISLDRYSSYHHAKERLAYAGFAAYVGVVIGALVANDWPPAHWGDNKYLTSISALVLLWAGILSYLNFQLRRRRWAALRVAGCEYVLANWATRDIDATQLGAAEPSCAYRKQLSDNNCWCKKLIGFVWPLKGAVRVMKVIEDARPHYPGVLVVEWERAEKRGTEALLHERLMIGAGWILFVASLLSCYI